MADTQSGVSLVLFYGVEGLTVADTDLNTGRAGNPSILIDKEQQFQETTLRFERDQFELTTQQSSRPVDYKSVGIEPMLELSIAQITLDNIKLSLGQTAIVTDPGGSAPRKLAIDDNVGEELVGQRVQLLPYPLPSLYTLNIAKGTNGEFYNPFHTEYTALITTGYAGTLESAGGVGVAATAAEADEFIAWRETIITLPNAAIIDVNQINLAFGLQTQRQLQVMLRGLPSGTDGVRLTFGSLDVT